jgi:DNA-directed RNA polymerase specialized sigma24 family protein
MSSQIDRRQRWQHLHQRLLAGSSPTVTSEIAAELLPAIVKGLMREFPQVGDPHLIETAGEDALLFYFDHPAQFDPARSSLFTYLRMRAKGYLLNSLGRQKSSQGGENVVELAGAETVYEVEAQNERDAEAALIEHESQTEIMQKLSEIITDPQDFQVLVLMLEGVRETSAFAAVLGITDRLLTDQTKLVKQRKDRIKKAVQRKMKI